MKKLAQNQNSNSLTQAYASIATHVLQGKVVSHITYQYLEKKDEYDWKQAAPIVVFTDGSQLIPIADEAMSTAGAFYLNENEIENIIPPI
jgi:hypothetical protein